MLTKVVKRFEREWEVWGIQDGGEEKRVRDEGKKEGEEGHLANLVHVLQVVDEQWGKVRVRC